MNSPPTPQHLGHKKSWNLTFLLRKLIQTSGVVFLPRNNQNWYTVSSVYVTEPIVFGQIQIWTLTLIVSSNENHNNDYFGNFCSSPSVICSNLNSFQFFLSLAILLILSPLAIPHFFHPLQSFRFFHPLQSFRFIHPLQSFPVFFHPSCNLSNSFTHCNRSKFFTPCNCSDSLLLAILSPLAILPVFGTHLAILQVFSLLAILPLPLFFLFVYLLCYKFHIQVLLVLMLAIFSDFVQNIAQCKT